MNIILEFEKPIVELEGKLKELKHLVNSVDSKARIESSKLEKKIDTTLKEIYKKLTPWEKVLVARHPGRPHFLDYINGFIEDYIPKKLQHTNLLEKYYKLNKVNLCDMVYSIHQHAQDVETLAQV